jgi:hypothetical protein
MARKMEVEKKTAISVGKKAQNGSGPAGLRFQTVKKRDSLVSVRMQVRY